MTYCEQCKYLFHDHSVGYSECSKENDFTDEEYEEYEKNGELKDCPYFEEDVTDVVDAYYLDMLHFYNDTD